MDIITIKKNNNLKYHINRDAIAYVKQHGHEVNRFIVHFIGGQEPLELKNLSSEEIYDLTLVDVDSK